MVTLFCDKGKSKWTHLWILLTMKFWTKEGVIINKEILGSLEFSLPLSDVLSPNPSFSFPKIFLSVEPDKLELKEIKPKFKVVQIPNIKFIQEIKIKTVGFLLILVKRCIISDMVEFD